MLATAGALLQDYYMAIEDIYDPSLNPIYTETTNAYIQEIPAVETHGIAKQLQENPGKIGAFVRQAIANNRVALRDLEVARRAIAYRASGLAEIFADPALFALVPEEYRQEVMEWASRVNPGTDISES